MKKENVIDLAAHRAVNICNAFQKKPKMAVFVVNGAVLSCTASSYLADKMFRTRPLTMVGVYDKRIKVDELADDLVYCLQGS